MQLYTPFLKFKQNEAAAIGEFSKRRHEQVLPFFDIPRPKENNEIGILEKLRTGLKHLEKHFPGRPFYIDNFDVDDSIQLQGIGQYKYILQSMADLPAIPVFALNRDDAHNPAAMEYTAKKHCKAAVRLTLEDVESYKLAKPELMALWKEIQGASPDEVHWIIDLRVINSDADALAATAVHFLNALAHDFPTDIVIISGSSIPGTLSAILGPGENKTIERSEWLVWQKIAKSAPEAIKDALVYGDYGIVSPDYSDVELESWLLQKLMAPKVFYPYSTKLLIVRGRAFQTHPKGYGQYFDIADTIANKEFFRGEDYSYGDKYIFDRSSLATKRSKKGGSPGSWVKAGVSSHLTFIVDSLLA